MSSDEGALRAMSSAVPRREPGSARPLVLVHGDFGDGFAAWAPACDLIGRRRRAIVIDRPGFGEDLPAETRFTIAGEARAMLDAAADMGVPSFHLVGHSYGALIALEMAVMQPNAVRSLHLIEPPLLDLLPEDLQVREMDRRVRRIVERHAEIGDEAATEAFFTMIGAERALERLRGSPDWGRLCGYATRFARGEPAGSYPSASLAKLAGTIPVGLYTGGRSHPALRLIAAELANRIHGARLIDVPEAGHAVQMARAAFVDALLAIADAADLDPEGRISVARANADRE